MDRKYMGHEYMKRAKTTGLTGGIKSLVNLGDSSLKCLAGKVECYEKRSRLRSYLLGWGAKRPINQLRKCSKRTAGRAEGKFQAQKYAYLAMKSGLSAIGPGASDPEMNSETNNNEVLL